MSAPITTVALVGNPNTGKSPLFSALVGVRQHVGNYPGVTVEKKTGETFAAGRRFTVVDLPGLYSLTAKARDEQVVLDVLVGRRRRGAPVVDAVVCVADASNLARNMFLVGQVLELGLPAVLALNMCDVAQRRGVRIDVPRLSARLGIPVVPVQAHRRIGLDALKATLAALPPRTERELPVETAGGGRRRRFRHCLGCGSDCAAQSEDVSARWDWVRRTLDGVVDVPADAPPTASDRIDRVLTNRFWGTLVFAAVMLLVFQAVFVWARPAMEAIETLQDAAGTWVATHTDPGVWRSLLVRGVIGGVGAVLSFLPQILILFGFIAVLEDCGYMARTAFLMDRLMSRVGLSGKSFIPLLSSFACTVPGIMAARVIENERDRLTTILVAPLLTCSARLPVYALLIAAFIPEQSYLGGLLNLQGMTLAGLYLLGILMAVVCALVFKRTILRGPAPPVLMELPGYKWPSPQTVLMRMVERGWVFLRAAGTIILAVSILVWAALYFPHDPNVPPQQQQRDSYLGMAGRVIEPVVRPLGWDWRIGCAVLASLPARG